MKTIPRPQFTYIDPMKAVVLEGKDLPLVVRDVPKPLPTPGMAVVRIIAASLNHRDVWISIGQYAGIQYPLVPGSDGVGVVEAVARNVDPNWVGKQVIINPSHQWGASEVAQGDAFKILGLPDQGTLAELVAVPVEYLHELPAHLTAEQGSALPLAGLTAFRALFSRARVQPGERVLVTGIGGGVALFALQFAKAAGCEVWVTSSSNAKLQAAEGLGANGGMNYKEDGWRKALQAKAGLFDVIIDGAGGAGFGELLNLASPGARIVIYGGTAGNIESISPQKLFWKQVSIMGSTMGSMADFHNMLRFVAANQIVPVIDEVFPVAEAQAAFDKMAAGKQFGKIVLTLG